MEHKLKEKNKRRLNFKLWNREKDVKILKYIAVAIVIVASIRVNSY